MNASKSKRTIEEFHLAFLEQLKEETPIDLLKTQEYEKLCVYLREKIQTRIMDELGALFNQKLLKKHWIDRLLVKLSNNGPVYLDVCHQAANLVYLNLMDAFELSGRETKEVMSVKFEEFLSICNINMNSLSISEAHAFLTINHNSNLLAWLSLDEINEISLIWLNSYTSQL